MKQRKIKILLSLFISSVALAEVEKETFDLSEYSLEAAFENVVSDVLFISDKNKKVRKMPVFENPYKALTDDEIKAKVKVLPNTRPVGLASEKIVPLKAAIALEDENTIEIFIPENRCQTGWVKWGNADTGYFKCPTLGRGDSVLGSLQLLAGLKEKVADYQSWILSENAGAFTEKNTKPNSRFEGENSYNYCLSRPETETNGQTIAYRNDSTIGFYDLQTGPKVHDGKEEWGTIPGSKRRLLPLKMVKIPDPRNNRYADEGRLILRDDFWVHSHENERDAWPLEAISTWGCPRLSRRCQVEIQKWTASALAEGRPLRLKVKEDDARALNFERE